MDDELDMHLEAVRRWIERVGDIPTLEPGLSTEEIQQQRVLNAAIEQLSRLRVAVPDDLRTLKLRLSARDAQWTAAQSALEERLVPVNEVVRALEELLEASRAIQERLKPKGMPTRKKNRYGISLLDLLQSGFLSTEDRLELSSTRSQETFEGKILQDGSVSAKTSGGWKQYSSLSGAVKDILDERSHPSGWDQWRVVNPDGSRVPLKEIRARFIKEGGET